MKRVRGSMKDLIQLTAVPDTTITAEEGQELDALRQVPMKNERQVQWAVEDAHGTKLPLPVWMAAPIERKVTEWASENKKWQDQIDARLCSGKALTPAAQRRYDEFVKLRTECKLLFSKSGERLVNKIRSNMDWKKMQNDLFCVQIHMSSDPQKLTLKASDGGAQRLLLWQGEPCHKGMLPTYLSKGKVSEEVMRAVLQEYDEDEDKENSGNEGSDAGDMEELADFMEAEALELMEREDSEDGEILANTSDEEALQELGQVDARRVKNFHHRPEYQALQARGVVELPPGCFLSYHKSSRSWQGIWPGPDQHGLSFTHDGTTKRSPGEALLCAIQALVERHTAQNPKDKLWRSQLEAIKKVGLTVAKL